jgi:hypothetical protein
MRLVGGICCQKFWQVVNGHVIHTTLHWTNKMMAKVWDVDVLVDNQVECPPCMWLIISNHTTHSLISLTSEGLVITHNEYWSLVV